MIPTIRFVSFTLALGIAAWLAHGGAAADEKPLAITAEQLAKEYNSDPAAADKKYKGKLLVVTGKVHAVYEVAGEPSVLLRGFRKKEPEATTLVQCSFTKEQHEKAGKLKKDDEFKVRGKCEGFGPVATTYVLLLTGCEFAK
jgi:hypothetical protein